MATLRSLVISLIARTEQFDAGMRKAERSLGSLHGKVNDLQRGLGRSASELVKFGAAAAGVGSALETVRKTFQAGLNLERINQQLLNVAGTSAGARQAVLLLEQTARATGFSLTVLAQGFVALQTAARGTSLSMEDVTRIFDQFVQAARASGVAEDQLGNIFEELTELLNQQTISLADLTPLLKQFPGLTDAMARAMGVNRAELERMSAAGELLMTVVLPRLAEEMGKTTTQNVQPLTTAVQQLGTAWEELWNTLGQLAVATGVVTAIEAVTGAVRGLVDLINSSKSAWDLLGKILMWRPGFIEPAPAPSAPAPTTPAPPPPPRVETGPAAELRRLEQELNQRTQDLEALSKKTEERLRRFPRDYENILREAAEAADQIRRDMQLRLQQMERSLRELEQQAQKTQQQAGKTAEAISPQRLAIRKVIEQLAPQYGLDPRLVEAIVARESAFDPRAVSKKGAQGLMQLMPPTARAMGVTDPFNIEQNLRGGMQYFAQLLKQFGDVAKALAAYNAGPGRVREAERGRPLPAETQQFVQDVTAEEERLKAAGTGAMEATAQATQTASAKLEEYRQRVAKAEQQFEALMAQPDKFAKAQERLAAEDRYIELLLETRREVDALRMSEDELARTSLERLQQQSEAQRQWQDILRKSPEAGADLLKSQVALAQEQRNMLTVESLVADMRQSGQQSVDDLVGSLEDQVRVLTLTNREYLAYQLHLKNAADWEVAHAQALQDKVERLGMARQAADQVTDALIDMAVTGEINLKNLQETFSRMALSMLADAIKIRQSLTKLIEKGLELAINALPGGYSGTASASEASAAVEGFRTAGYGGGLQHGGAVVPGRFYTVGETGPELLVAGSAGTVVPGGARPIQIIQNIRTLDADSFRRSGDQIAAQMVTAAQRARRVL